MWVDVGLPYEWLLGAGLRLEGEDLCGGWLALP